MVMGITGIQRVTLDSRGNGNVDVNGVWERDKNVMGIGLAYSFSQ